VEGRKEVGWGKAHEETHADEAVSSVAYELFYGSVPVPKRENVAEVYLRA
jgi:hypothetical protein